MELSSHSFYKHIFPQITKFFSFLRTGNPNQIELVDEMYRIISTNEKLLMRFKEKIKDEDLYKMLKDTIESSQDILILIDENIKAVTFLLLLIIFYASLVIRKSCKKIILKNKNFNHLT